MRGLAARDRLVGSRSRGTSAGAAGGRGAGEGMGESEGSCPLYGSIAREGEGPWEPEELDTGPRATHAPTPTHGPAARPAFLRSGPRTARPPSPAPSPSRAVAFSVALSLRARPLLGDLPGPSGAAGPYLVANSSRHVSFF